MGELIKIFIGCAPDGADAESCSVLEYTLRKHASQPLDIHWMILSRDPTSPFYSNGIKGWQTENWPTPFSAFRWAVPALCNFTGKAIYMDSDTIVLDDIAKLWNQAHGRGKIVIGNNASRLCVSLWDCQSARFVMLPMEELKDKDGHNKMRARMAGWPLSIQPFKDGDWNCLDGKGFKSLSDPRLKLIHYTSMPHQPSSSHAVIRLAKRNQTHWFDGKFATHWRPDLVELFNKLLIESVVDFPIYKYDPGVIFGDYKKANLSGLRGQKPGWAS